MFAYEQQGKGLRDRECVRVANTGLRRARFCAFDARRKVNGGRRLKVESRGPMPESPGQIFRCSTRTTERRLRIAGATGWSLTTTIYCTCREERRKTVRKDKNESLYSNCEHVNENSKTASMRQAPVSTPGFAQTGAAACERELQRVCWPNCWCEPFGIAIVACDVFGFRSVTRGFSAS